MNVVNLINAARKVTADNKAFKKLSKREKRVAVAKDAIAQLLLGSYQPKKGSYVKIAHGGVLTSILGKDMPQCQVCGIGSALLSEFRLSGQCNKLTGIGCVAGDYTYDNRGVGIFSTKMLAAMEGAFERWSRDNLGEWGNGWDAPDCDRAALSYISNEEVRLYAILQNVVDNGGTFKCKTANHGKAVERAIDDAARITAEYAKLKTRALEYARRAAA